MEPVELDEQGLFLVPAIQLEYKCDEETAQGVCSLMYLLFRVGYEKGRANTPLVGIDMTPIDDAVSVVQAKLHLDADDERISGIFYDAYAEGQDARRNASMPNVPRWDSRILN